MDTGERDQHRKPLITSLKESVHAVTFKLYRKKEKRTSKLTDADADWRLETWSEETVGASELKQNPRKCGREFIGSFCELSEASIQYETKRTFNIMRVRIWEKQWQNYSCIISFYISIIRMAAEQSSIKWWQRTVQQLQGTSYPQFSVSYWKDCNWLLRKVWVKIKQVIVFFMTLILTW